MTESRLDFYKTMGLEIDQPEPVKTEPVSEKPVDTPSFILDAVSFECEASEISKAIERFGITGLVSVRIDRKES